MNYPEVKQRAYPMQISTNYCLLNLNQTRTSFICFMPRIKQDSLCYGVPQAKSHRNAFLQNGRISLLLLQVLKETKISVQAEFQVRLGKILGMAKKGTPLWCFLRMQVASPGVKNNTVEFAMTGFPQHPTVSHDTAGSTHLQPHS